MNTENHTKHNGLPPVVVFGLGMSHQLLKKGSNDDDHRKILPLLEWSALLRKVASQTGTECVFRTELAS